MQRRDIHYSGRVQGVGFRYTVRDVANGFAVTGFVRNLDDGRVHLVAEGEVAEIDAFLAEIDAFLAEIDAFLAEIALRMKPNIRHVDDQQAPATAEFAGFTIRF
jgi:acylphosphatase